MSFFSEYRSAIFTHSPEQEEIAKRVTEEIQAKYFTPKGMSALYFIRYWFHTLACAHDYPLLGQKIVTEIVPAGQWWNAEDYHQLYLFKNPSGYQCPTHRLHW